MTRPLRISVLIVNFKIYVELTRCLESLRRFSGEDVEVIVIDHDSDSNRAAELAARFAWVRLLPRRSNQGFAAGINEAARNASGDYLLLLNPDCIVIDDVLHVLAGYLEGHAEVGVAGALVRETDGSVQASARRFPSFVTGIAGRTGFVSRWWPNNPLTAANLIKPSPSREPVGVDWVAGSCMMVRRDAFDAVGGFDERFFMYWEDADLCFRLRRKGWTTVYVPAAEVIHLTGRSTERAPLRPLVAFHRSAFLYFRKNGNRRLQLFAPLVFLGLHLRLLFKLARLMFSSKRAVS